jgi:hypothetical protein
MGTRALGINKATLILSLAGIWALAAASWQVVSHLVAGVAVVVISHTLEFVEVFLLDPFLSAHIDFVDDVNEQIH